MVVYNIPALSGVRFSLDQINELVTIPGVCALKQTSGDLFQMEQIKRNHPELVLYNGYDEIFASGLIAGADGGIGSTYNIMGWRYLKIFEAVKNNDVIKAKEMQVACNGLLTLLFRVVSGRYKNSSLLYGDYKYSCMQKSFFSGKGKESGCIIKTCRATARRT